MSVIPSLTSGMMGKSDAKFLVPSSGIGGDVFGNSQPALGEVKYTKAPPLLNPVIDVTTRDMVLPCKGITHHILRSANPVPDGNAYQAPMGIARGQERGLQYQPQHPLNNPIMPSASSIFAGQNSTIGAPR